MPSSYWAKLPRYNSSIVLKTNKNLWHEKYLTYQAYVFVMYSLSSCSG